MPTTKYSRVSEDIVTAEDTWVKGTCDSSSQPSGYTSVKIIASTMDETITTGFSVINSNQAIDRLNTKLILTLNMVYFNLATGSFIVIIPTRFSNFGVNPLFPTCPFLLETQ